MECLTVVVNTVILGISLPVSPGNSLTCQVPKPNLCVQPVAVACALFAYPFNALRKLLVDVKVSFLMQKLTNFA